MRGEAVLGFSGSSGGSSSSEKETGTEKEQDNSKKYTIKTKGILNDDEDIQWENVKSKIENLYISIPNMTLELYQIGIEQKDVLDFNAQYDNLVKVVKEEEKEKTLEHLASLYEYIPKYIEKTSDDDKEKMLIKSKSSIMKAYSILDSEDWQSISQNLKIAIEEYSKMLTGIPKEDTSQYSINKGYVLLNELQNAVVTEDKEVFLIKYKNLLEEINNI